jgi:hypothetical protein
MSLPHASLFSQLLDLIPRDKFELLVRQHRAEKGAKGFACWDQFVAMLFCQLGQAHSLREISMGLASALGKLVHLGVQEAPKRSTLAYANEHRPWTLYQAVFDEVLKSAQTLAQERGRAPLRFKNPLYSLDATVIDLCLEVFDWARYRRTKGAVKLHLVLDHQGYLPTFAHITEGKIHEVKMAQRLNLPCGSIVAMDRGYNDYTLFASWCEREIFFVTRMKDNAVYEVVDSLPVPDGTKIRKDEMILLTGTGAQEKCPYLLRRTVVWDAEQEREIVLLSNIFQFAASTIARIYKERWKIELFFKALKQNLRVKTFVGTSANALKIQIWTALIAILLLKVLQLKSTFGWSLSNLVAILRMNLFTYRDLWKWIDEPLTVLPLQAQSEQLKLNFG